MKQSLISRFLHVEFKIPLCRAQRVLQIGENQKSILLGTDHLISRGGGWDFSSRQVIFFSLLAQQGIFFKSKPQQVFYFFEKITH